MTTTHEDLHRDIGRLVGTVEQLERKVDQLSTDVASVKAQADRWKGAFAVILGLGALVGWFADKLWSVLNPGQ